MKSLQLQLFIIAEVNAISTSPSPSVLIASSGIADENKSCGI